MILIRQCGRAYLLKYQYGQLLHRACDGRLFVPISGEHDDGPEMCGESFVEEQSGIDNVNRMRLFKAVAMDEQGYMQWWTV